MKRGISLIVTALMLLCVFGAGGTVLAGEDSPAASEEAPGVYSLNDFYFDTVVSIRFDAGENGDELLSGCRSMCSEFEKTFSRTDEESELYRVNHRKKDRVEVSGELAGLVQTGLDYYDISNGRFDITVAPLSDLWDFKSGEPTVPPEAKIQSALRKVDASRVHVETKEDADGKTKWFLSFDDPDTMIDLGALVKGYAADRLADYLKENGVESGLINLGGNVLAIGTKEDGSDWKIGIQKPFESDIIDTVQVEDRSVVTSGVYERCFEQDGVLYHHILDPETGYPVQNNLWGVSIISESSLTGDALSTVCMLLGLEEATELIRQTEDVEAIFIDSDLHETMTE